jgi:hypothetical protein
MQSPEIFKSDKTFSQPIVWVTTLFMVAFHGHRDVSIHRLLFARLLQPLKTGLVAQARGP